VGAIRRRKTENILQFFSLTFSDKITDILFCQKKKVTDILPSSENKIKNGSKKVNVHLV
jgi:hypothetical protein